VGLSKSEGTDVGMLLDTDDVGLLDVMSSGFTLGKFVGKKVELRFTVALGFEVGFKMGNELG